VQRLVRDGAGFWVPVDMGIGVWEGMAIRNSIRARCRGKVGDLFTCIMI